MKVSTLKKIYVRLDDLDDEIRDYLMYDDDLKCSSEFLELSSKFGECLNLLNQILKEYGINHYK